MAPKASAYFDALRIPLVLLGVFGIAFTAYYFLYVTNQQEYLTGRNFRLLATIGEQIDAAIENDHVVLSNLLSAERAGGQTRDVEHNGALTLEAMVGPLASEFIPVLGTASLTQPGKDPCASKHASPPTLRIKFVEQDSGATWVHCDDEIGKPAQRPATVQLDLDAVLKPLLTGELQSSIFDAVFVAASDGRVIFRSGDPRLRITRLDKLPLDSRPPAELNFGQVSRSSAMVDVRLSGLRYRLLLQPCCGRMVRGDATTVDAAGWVLGGLTAQSTMAAASAAVSFSMMTLLLVLVLLALFSWPFLKLRFIGESQRVKAHDVVLVGLGALLTIALVTVSTLDLYAYWRLETVLDDQLQRFAWTIKSQAQQEISAAYSELTHLGPRFANAFPKEEQVGNLGDRNDSAGHDFIQYPFFESLAFLDEHGAQRQKLTFDSFVTPLINTKTREYFTYWQSSGSQPAFLQPLQSATTGSREAVLSMPLSQHHEVFRVAAMTIPMHALIEPVIPPGFGFAVISLDGQVLFHSDPDHNLSENFFVEADGSRRLRALVSARHEEWVDFKYWGGDHRAWVTPMELTVNPSDQEAAKPIAASGAPWTLVTFYDKDLARTVNVEWLVIVVVLLIIYTNIYMAICLAVLFVRPKYRAPWLWPDPVRSRAYLAAIPPLLILSVTFALSIALLSPGDLIAVAVLLPVVVWALTYRMLAPFAERTGVRRVGTIAACVLAPVLLLLVRRGILGWQGVLVAVLGSAAAWAIGVIGQRSKGKLLPLAPPVSVSYGLAAGLFLLLIAALPSAAFFKVAYDTELESLIKYGQLQLALDRSEHERQANGKLTRRITPQESRDRVAKLRADRSQWWGGYDTFFFCTQPLGRTVEPVPGCPQAVPPATRTTSGEAETQHASGETETLTAIVEELLPFYSEFSVRLREFVHDQPADKSRSWNRAGANLYFRMGPTEAAFVSLKPSFMDWGTAEQPSLWGWILLALVAGCVLGAVAWVARFITHTVFVVDVIEPLWSGNEDPLGDTWGSHLFVVSSEQEIARPPLSTYCKLDLTEAPSEDTDESLWFDDQIDRLAQTPASQNVLILHFEHRFQDRRFNERKLATLERIVQTLHRTIVIISAIPPGVFFTASGTARDQNDVDSSRRWTELLSRFTIIPARPVAPVPPASEREGAPVTEWATAGWREIVWRLNALGFAQRAKFLAEEQRHPMVGRFWKAVLPYAWHPDRPALDITQLLVEVGERAEGYYREIWATCTPAEKLVLGQVAEEGLVNEKTKMTVRLLMARGLIRRQPHFVLMNETFRQFVLSPYVRSEVAELEEQSSGTWDVIRWPFLVVLITILSFFFATQQELSKSVLGVVAAGATVLPAVVKIVSMFGDRRSAA